MPLTNGTKLGPYEIVSPLGAGGMGEVFRARDTRLERSVAIKILATHLSADADAKRRFDAEARAISCLQHPNICTLYDVGHQDGLDYLVMEYLEGETLAERLIRGPLPLSDLLKYAADICDGLDKAHAHGVVHRDLKPGNIMLTDSGAKIMDFGLAKVALPPSSAALTLATSGDPQTAPGLLTGTFQYMAPELLEGKPADARSDIFALGAVLYEMATGRRAFDGKSTASVIAAVLDRELPPIGSFRPGCPMALERIVRICLAKKPDDRWHSAHDVKLQLGGVKEDQQSESAAASLDQKANTREKIAWGLVAMLLAAAVLATGFNLRHAAPLAQPIRSSIQPPTNWSFLFNGAALSPDGTRLAFVGVGPNGETTLWVRSLEGGAAQQLSGTDGANRPFWSPDNTRLGFFAEDKLKTVDAGGGSARTLCAAPFGRGGTWNRDGTIVFAPELYGPLYRVSENGGAPAPVTAVLRAGSSSQSHTWPSFLPDGKHFLYAVVWSAPEDTVGTGIYVGSLDGGTPKLVSSEFAGNVAFASGKLLYVRDLTLTAQSFDPDRLELSGSAVPVSDQPVATNSDFSLSAFSVSQTGLLVFQSVADLASQLVWFSAGGKEVGQLTAVGPKDPALSPDGHLVAFASDEARNGKYYVHVYDVARDVATRITDSGHDESPAWSRDGKNLAYKTADGKTNYIYQIAANGSTAPELLLKGSRMGMLDWAPDGHLVFADFSHGRPSLAVHSTLDHKVTPLYRGAEPRVSPDGHWVAYTFSAGTGFQPGIFVQPFPGPGPRLQISRSGGAQATWSRDGKQIFFIAPDKKMMAADFDAQHQTVSSPRALFQTRVIAPSFVSRQYDVAADGRFLINSLPQGSAPPLTLLTNWPAQRKQ